jgi:hypothetical protein
MHAMAKTGTVPTLGLPDDPSLPFFAYGLLKPGELAFPQVERFVISEKRATAPGTLWLRDGIPLFDPEGDGEVDGRLLWFDATRIEEAWSIVTSFEPATQYRWSVVEAHAQREREPANVLEGRQLQDGTSGENFEEWSAGRDPIVEGTWLARTRDGLVGDPFDRREREKHGVGRGS